MPNRRSHRAIKKENIGLIEVMGLAVLPSRLKNELDLLAKAILLGSDVRNDERIAKHAEWLESFKNNYAFTEENVMSILKAEVGRTFVGVLEDAGVYKRDRAGKEGFLRFVETI